MELGSLGCLPEDEGGYAFGSVGLQPLDHVLVRMPGDERAGVAEPLGDDLDVDPGDERQGGPGVAQIVQTDAGEIREARLGEAPVERLRPLGGRAGRRAGRRRDLGRRRRCRRGASPQPGGPSSCGERRRCGRPVRSPVPSLIWCAEEGGPPGPGRSAWLGGSWRMAARARSRSTSCQRSPSASPRRQPVVARNSQDQWYWTTPLAGAGAGLPAKSARYDSEGSARNGVGWDPHAPNDVCVRSSLCLPAGGPARTLRDDRVVPSRTATCKVERRSARGSGAFVRFEESVSSRASPGG